MGPTTILQLNSRITQAKQKGKVFGRWKWLAAELLFFVDFILLLDFEKLVFFSNSSDPSSDPVAKALDLKHA